MIILLLKDYSTVFFKMNLLFRYLQEYTALGTAGGIYHFRDRILSGGTGNVLVFNGDVCADFPLKSIIDFHEEANSCNFVTHFDFLLFANHCPASFNLALDNQQSGNTS